MTDTPTDTPTATRTPTDTPTNSPTATSTPTNTPEVPGGQIAPTGTTCQQFSSGTASTLTNFNFAVRGGFISTDNPGVFFYYATLTAPVAGAQTIHVTQTVDQAGYLVHVLNDSTSQMILYDANCNVISGVTRHASNPADVTFALPSSTSAGQVYILSVKYTPKSVVGLDAPNPSTLNYTFNSTNTPGTQKLQGIKSMG